MRDDDLNDSLDDIFDRSHLPKQAGQMPSIKDELVNRTVDKKIERAAPRFSEPCKACRGRGRFISYVGRDVGPCFHCKGTGKKEFRTDAATREKRRVQAEEKKQRNITEAHETYKAAHPQAYAWILAQAPRFEFAKSMLEALTKFGSLTEKQQAAIDRCVERETARQAERAARVASAKDIDVSKIEAAFDHARNAAADDGEGIKWLKLYLDTFTFLDAPARGNWPAAILVREGNTKLGRIVGGKFTRSFACDDATEARIVSAAADPAAAAKAFGLRTGVCSCCGRELTNAESRERGIGPICAGKYGF